MTITTRITNPAFPTQCSDLGMLHSKARSLGVKLLQESLEGTFTHKTLYRLAKWCSTSPPYLRPYHVAARLSQMIAGRTLHRREFEE